MLVNTAALLFVVLCWLSLGGLAQTEQLEAEAWNETDAAVDVAAPQPPQQFLDYGSSMSKEMVEEPVHYRLDRHLMSHYNNRLIPRRNTKVPIQVLFTIGLYQIIEVNEPQQYILLNSWIVERWRDDLLYWDAGRFEGLREIVLPRESVWIPDTTLYNSLVMDDAESRRILNVKVNTLEREKSALVEMLYPTLYQFSCMLDLRFFPFDIQHCVMTFGSWSHDNKHIDYFAFDDSVDRVVPTLANNGTAPGGGEQQHGGIGIEHCIPNEGWNILSTAVARREVKFHCCENNYTLLEFTLHIQRKPLFYLVNLIVPTSIITLIAIVGFFSSSTVNDVRDEKISLGITTLLSMSILIFMVSDQMPSTSSFIPLIGWFYTSMMALISFGTLAASIVIYVQKKGIIGQRPSRKTMRWARRLGRIIWMEMPLMMKQAYAIKAKQDKMAKLRAQMAEQQKRQQAEEAKNAAQNGPFGVGTPPRRPGWWQPKTWQTRIGQMQRDSVVSASQSSLSNAGVLHRYRTNTSSDANGRAQTGAASFVGSTLGNAMKTQMAFLVPKGEQQPHGKETLCHKLSAPDGANTVTFLSQTQTHSYNTNSINEECSDDFDSSDDATGSSMDSDKRQQQRRKKESAEEKRSTNTAGGGATGDALSMSTSINLIDMDTPTEEQQQRRKEALDVSGLIKAEQAAEEGGGAEEETVGGGEALDSLEPEGSHLQTPSPSYFTQQRPERGCFFRDRSATGDSEPREQRQKKEENPLIENARAMHHFVKGVVERQNAREQERIIQTEMTKARRNKPPPFSRRNTSQSMADLYAASLFPATPNSEPAVPGAGGADTSATLAEASAALSALHPQVQRNLAEIEYDWLAAVVERMFLILFSTLFFLTSFGINGIGLYYWYFTYQDTIERS